MIRVCLSLMVLIVPVISRAAGIPGDAISHQLCPLTPWLTNDIAVVVTALVVCAMVVIVVKSRKFRGLAVGVLVIILLVTGAVQVVEAVSGMQPVNPECEYRL